MFFSPTMIGLCLLLVVVMESSDISFSLFLLELVLVDEKDLVEAWELILDWEDTLVILDFERTACLVAIVG